MFDTATVTLVRPGKPTVDRLGNHVPGKPTSESVSGVLIDSPTTSEMEAARIEGVTLAYTLRWPKAHTASLEGCTIQLPDPWALDGGYRVVGDPRPLMAANTPGPWNRDVRLEAAYG